MKIIPAIDIRDGQCVRLFQGDFEKSTVYSADPAAVAQNFSRLAVADLHIVDLDGARSGLQSNHSAVASIVAQTGLAVQVGGGIRSRSDIVAWLDAGVSRCVIGSMAISEPDCVKDWIDEFGAEAIVLALDARLDVDGVPRLTTDGWTADSKISLWQCLENYGSSDRYHVLCTDVGRDGAMTGPNFSLYEETLRRFPDIQLQASGGVRNLGDLTDLRALGVPAAIVGRALLDGAINEREVAEFQQNA